MTTIVIQAGNIFTDSKLTILDESLKDGLKAELKKLYFSGNETVRKSVKITANSSFFNKKTMSLDMSKGKFISLKGVSMEGIEGELAGATFAGNANIAPALEYFFKTKANKPSLQGLLEWIANEDNSAVELTKEFYGHQYSEQEILTMSVFFVAIVTTERTYVLNRKSLLEPQEGFVAHWVPSNIAVTFGSGSDILRGIERQSQKILDGNWISYYANPFIRSAEDAIDFIKRASEVDAMTGDVVSSLN